MKVNDRHIQSKFLVRSSKCEGLGDVMVMEKAARVKKRKSRLEESEDLQASSVQLKTRRLADVTPVNLPRSRWESAAGSYGALGSCCSGNGSSDLAEVAPEEEVNGSQFLVTSNGVALERRERSESSGEMESTARPNESNPRRGCFTAEKMPSEDDLEEFFSSAEKNLQKQFSNKYNYDVVKDKAMEGRFKWVQIQQIQP